LNAFLKEAAEREIRRAIEETRLLTLLGRVVRGRRDWGCKALPIGSSAFPTACLGLGGMTTRPCRRGTGY
jgi:hypothetical protein